MKKLFYRSFLLIFTFSLILIIYLSTLGIETDKFNNQISNQIKNINKDLKIDLKKIKLLLDPFNLKINLKTYGSTIINKKNYIELENIQTQISIKSYIENKFILSNLNISTKSLNIKKLISFIRTFEKKPELYILEKFIKKGYLIADISLQFDEKGKIKDNFAIKGVISDSKIIINKYYNLDKINFAFDINGKNFDFKDIGFKFNQVPFFSDGINTQVLKDKFFVKGELNNKNIDLNEKDFDFLTSEFFSKVDLTNLNFESNNKFSFSLNKKFDLDNLRISSLLKISNLTVVNLPEIRNFFPENKRQVEFSDQTINLDYSKNNLIIEGKGKISLQKKKDNISFYIKKKGGVYDFNSKITIINNPLNLELLNYKNSQTKKTISFEGTHSNNKTIFKSLALEEDDNEIKIKNLIINDEFKIDSFDNIILNYLDNDNKRNEVTLKRSNKVYLVKGKSFNANQLIQNLIDNTEDKNFINKNIKFDLAIEKIFFDNENTINDLKGELYFRNNELYKGNLKAYFSNNKELKFTVISNGGTKVTTLFLDEAEPLVKKYKFIKGYKGGSLDLYSSKIGNKSDSTLKIYDFKLKELPVLTKILTLASLQGIADILSGEGIGFDEFEMNFQNQGNKITIEEIYAIGPAISIMMSGYIEKNKVISLKGTLVPATTINKAIGSIPVLGKILVGSKTGEGVFGVSFKIKGPPKKLETTVNPIKTLTPRFITRTLEKIKKN